MFWSVPLYVQVKDEEDLEDHSSPDDGLVMNRNAALMDEDESD